MFICLSKKQIVSAIMLIILVAGIVLSFQFLSNNSTAFVPDTSFKIVIDAGHGGIDGGSVGQAGTIERDINLQYAKTLEKFLNSAGIKTKQTRKDENGLYSQSAKYKKLDDMQKRMKIVDNEKPNLIISIHMNSFGSSKVWGANCFYKKESEDGKILATYIQKAFKKYGDTYNSEPKVGDYYMLNFAPCTAVLVECGFLSNPIEEELLNTEEYRNKICYCIYCGILLFLGNFIY